MLVLNSNSLMQACSSAVTVQYSYSTVQDSVHDAACSLGAALRLVGCRGLIFLLICDGWHPGLGLSASAGVGYVRCLMPMLRVGSGAYKYLENKYEYSKGKGVSRRGLYWNTY